MRAGICAIQAGPPPVSPSTICRLQVNTEP